MLQGLRFQKPVLAPEQGSPQPPGCPGRPPTKGLETQPEQGATQAAGLNGDKAKVRGLRNWSCPSREPGLGQGPAYWLRIPSQSVLALGTQALCCPARGSTSLLPLQSHTLCSQLSTSNGWDRERAQGSGRDTASGFKDKKPGCGSWCLGLSHKALEGRAGRPESELTGDK